MLTRTERLWVQRITGVLGITLMSRFIGFLYPVLVLRELDRSAAGLAFFFINSAYFVVQPVSGGPAMAMVRPIAAASTDDERAQWLRAAAAAVMPGLGLALAVAVIACLTSGAPVWPMFLMVFGLSFDTMYFQVLTARHRYTAAATYRLLANIGQLMALVLVFAMGWHSIALVVGIFALSYGVGFAVVEAKQRILLRLIRRAVSATRGQRRELMAAAVPTAITGLAYSGITGLDTYLVRLARPDLVATYGAAKTLAAPFLLVTVAITTIVQPETARAGPRQAMAIRRRMLLVGAGGGALAIACCWVFAPLAVHTVYGARYPGAAISLSWLGTGVTLLGIHTLLQVWCWGRGRYRMPLISLGTGAGIAILVNLALVSRVGAYGAGVAVCVGSAVATVLLIILTRVTDGRDTDAALVGATESPVERSRLPRGEESSLQHAGITPTATPGVMGRL